MNVGTTMRFTIKLKLASTFAVIIVLAGAMAWFGISSLGSLNTTMGDLLQGPVQRALIEHQLENDMLQILRAEKNMLLADTPNEIAKYDAEELAARSQFVARLDKVVAIGTTEGRKRIAVLNAPWQKWVTVQDRVRELTRTGKLAEAKALHMEQGRLLTTEIGKVLTEVIDLNNQYMQETRHQAEAQYDTMRNMLLIAAAAVLLIGVAAGIWMSLSI